LLENPSEALAPVYASDLSAMISRHQPAAWYCGHTHHRTETWLGSTRICNLSLGYPEDNTPQQMRAVILRGLVDLE
jgi:hypothetical protein